MCNDPFDDNYDWMRKEKHGEKPSDSDSEYCVVKYTRRTSQWGECSEFEEKFKSVDDAVNYKKYVEEKLDAFDISLKMITPHSSFKIGIDVHGVLDARPHFWVNFAKQIKNYGGEIHIITGKSWGKDVEDQLRSYDGGEKWWDCFFSIDDYLRDVKELTPFIDYKGGRCYPEDEWNKAKSEYCQDNEITIMFDDSPRYGIYFTTPYFQIGNRVETPESRRLEDKIIQLTKQIEKYERELEKYECDFGHMDQCPKCKTRNDEDVTYCRGCGEKLK